MRGDNNAPRFLFCCCCGKLRCPGWVNKNRPGGKKGSSEFRNRSREHEKGVGDFVDGVAVDVVYSLDGRMKC